MCSNNNVMSYLFRALRVMRVSLLAGEIRNVKFQTYTYDVPAITM